MAQPDCIVTRHSLQVRSDAFRREQSWAAIAEQHLLDRGYEEGQRLAGASLGLHNHVRACNSTP